MSRFAINWGDGRLDRVRALAARGVSGPDISKSVGVPIAALRRKMAKEGIKIAARTRDEKKRQFAEALSKTGDVHLASLEADVQRTAGYKFLSEMRAELGWQAS